MDRRRVIAALACWSAGRLQAQDEAPRPRHKISAGELHEALSARFPVRLGSGGLLELEVTAPRLLLLPTRQLLGATLAVRFSGLPMQQLASGELDLVFAVRYEPSDQTLRAHHPEILDLRWPGLPPDAAAALRMLLPRVAREVAGEVVLHAFTPRELALPKTMGFEPREVLVLEDGVEIVFGR